MTAHARRASRAGVIALAALACWSCTNTSNNARPGSGPSPGAGGAGAGPAAPDGATGGAPADAPIIAAREPGYVWFAGAALSAFTKSETAASHARGPGVALSPDPAARGYHDLAFDGAGNLWAVPVSGDRLLRVPASALGSDDPPPVDLTISSPALVGAQSLAFDAAGNLWVMSYAGAGPSVATILRFDDPRALTGAVTLAPSAVVTPGTSPEAVARFSQGSAIAFDREGNLWFAAISNVLRLDRPGDLRGEIIAGPAAVVGAGDAAFVSLAFDAGGSLWITGAREGYFALRIADPGALRGSTVMSPAATLRLPGAPATFAGGAAFDAAGDLWVALSDRLLRFERPATLTGESTPAPATTLGLSNPPDLASKLVLRAPAP